MLFEVMDWALWDPALDQAVQESSYNMEEWQCDFYFGYGLDSIEENALNEKLCIQVLRILISKADAEIVELEEDLVGIQSQLASADEEWSKMCSATLTEKINCLVTAIQSLKNENIQEKHDFGVCLLLPREPAKQVHEILMTLLRNYFQQKDKQLEIISVQNSNSSAEIPVIGISCQGRILTNSDSKVKSEEVKERNSVADPILDIALKHQEKATDVNVEGALFSPSRRTINVAQKDKHMDIIVKYCSSNALKHATDNSSEKKESSNLDSEFKRKGESQKHKFRSKYRRKISNSSQESAITHAGAILKDSNSQASRHSTDQNGMNKLSMIDSKVTGGNEVKGACTTDKSIVLKSSLEPGQKQTNISEEIEPADTFLYSRSNASKKTTEDSDAKPNFTGGSEAVQTSKMNSSNLSLKTEKKLIKTLGGVKGLESSLIDTEHVVADSILEMLSQTRGNATKPLPMKRQRLQPKQVQKAELDATDDNMNLNLTLLPQRPPQRQRGRREYKLNPVFAQKLAVGASSNTSPITKVKRQRASRMAEKSVSFNQSTSRENEKKALSDLCHAKEEHDAIPDVGINLVSLSRNKRKWISNLSYIDKTKELRGLQISLPILHAMDSTSRKDLCITENFLAKDSNNEIVKSLRCTTPTDPTRSILDTEALTLVDLRAIAKQMKLKGYYKLRKAQLKEQLNLMIQNRGGCA